MQKKKIKGLHFQPWVGENYGNGKYGRLLLLGESHYWTKIRHRQFYEPGIKNQYQNEMK